MEVITKTNLEKLKEEIDNTRISLRLDEKENRFKQLQLDANDPTFWNDTNNAKSVMSEIEKLNTEIKTANGLSNDIGATLEIFNTTPEENIESLRPDIIDIEKRYKEFEIFKFLSGKYDKENAILSIHAGQGGTEANDWANMLLRMYQRYCERKGWKSEIVHMVPGTETGISSATIMISGLYAFGKLKREAGTHRLVRLSPFNAQNLRQTSFAGIEVIPVIPEGESEITIPSEDIEFKAVRAGGAGGQKVNKTSSAVQIKHIPTGITVFSSSRRDQFQNKEAAMNILKAKLWQIEEEKREEELSKIKGVHKIAGWGNQIRNYVLHPYKLVKDLRTKVESQNPTDVLDGNLDAFVDYEIRIG
ncbi:peptide chain release factor 2 [Candidatus Dojkabacteria bacterium]|jgi:peptide chain release factor 2|nr:peptide chain release factor 2 [Candidatus Dojkabacteria bacterium]